MKLDMKQVTAYASRGGRGNIATEVEVAA